MRPRNVLFGVFITLWPCFALSAPAPAPAPWGDVHGRIVWSGDKIPPCSAVLNLKREWLAVYLYWPIFSDELVVDPKTKGVRDAIVWLAPDTRNVSEMNEAIPIHPDLRALKTREVQIDIAHLQFVPHCTALRSGQFVHFTNRTPFTQNLKLDGDIDAGNANFNLLLTAELTSGPFKVQRSPLLVSDTIYPHMSAYIRVFDHPYFAVTGDDGRFTIKNAPAGKFRLVVWHPAQGWLVGDTIPDKFGRRVEIKAGEVITVDAVKMLPKE